MATSIVTARAPTGPEVEKLDRDAVFDVLCNQRRRFIIHYLKWEGGDVGLKDLVDRVAAWETEKSVSEVTATDRKRVQTALHQFHLPKMEDLGFVEYDLQQGAVRLSDRAAETNFYVDVLPPWEIPWGLYYLSLSGLSLFFLGGAALQLPLVASVSADLWCLFFAAALSFSSVGHFYDNYYRMRLGAREHPLELTR